MRIGVVTNPRSRKNRGRPGRVRALAAIVGDAGVVVETPDVEAIKPALRRFLHESADIWVSDGGDGALHWMLRLGQEVLAEPEFAGRATPLLLPTNGGTIDFVARSAGIRGNAEQLLAGLRAIERPEDLDIVELDAMHVEGVQRTPEGDRSFRSVGFAAAAGGIGQRFFSRYYAAPDPNPAQIVRVVAKAVASAPFSLTPLRHVPGLPATLRDYARDLFRPTPARLVVDGEPSPARTHSALHVASIPVNLGDVMRFFTQAAPGRLHAIYGTPSPWTMIRNLPRMPLGRPMSGDDVVDGPCRSMTVEADGDELLAPVIDGEYYDDVVRVSFSPGLRLRFAQVRGRA